MARKKDRHPYLSGFTIVELLVVIVVIGILASFVLISYTGIANKAIAASLHSDLKSAATSLEIQNTTDGSYPATEADANGGKGFSSSPETTYQYTLDGNNYCLSATSGTQAYHISSLTGTIEDGVCEGQTAPGGGAPPMKQVAAATYDSCAIATGNLAYCWGLNGNGQLGNNTTTNSLIPVAVSTVGAMSGKTFKSITMGYTHVCAIASDDQAYCWGDNGNAQFGDNTFNESHVPVAVYTAGVLSGKTIKSLSTLHVHTCAIASDDQAYCWGYNSTGGLGNNSTTFSKVPVAVYTAGVLSGKTIKSISVGYQYTCAIASDNNAYCWGGNDYGGLGNNSTTFSKVPVAVSTAGVLSGKTIKSISVNTYHTCAVASDNLAYCWGSNWYGELGNSSTVESHVPVAVNTTGVLSGKTIKSVVAGDDSSCAIASDDQVYCWGRNPYGQLGNNTTSNSTIPVAVNIAGALNGKTVGSISAGISHYCAVASDNQTYCWGWNNTGQLGNNSTTNSLVPIATTPLP